MTYAINIQLVFPLLMLLLHLTGCIPSTQVDHTDEKNVKKAMGWVWATQPPMEAGSIIEPRYAESALGPNGNIFYLTTLVDMTSKKNQLYLSCRNPNGVELWNRNFPGMVVAQSLSLDSNGDLWTAGTFTGELNLDGNRLSAGEEPTWMMAKFNRINGKCQFALGGTGHRSFVFGRMDARDRFWMVGNHDGMIPKNPSAWMNGRQTTGFLVCYDQTGKQLWTRELDTQDFVRVSQMRPLPDGSMVLGGTFEENLKIGDQELRAGAGMEQEGFIASINPDGSTQWIKQIGSIDSESYTTSVTDGVIDLIPDQKGGLYVTGKLHDRMVFGRDKLKLDNYEEDCYLAYMDSLGEFKWGRQISGNHAGGNSLTQGPEGNVWVSGFFNGPLTLGKYEVEDTIGHDNCYIAEFTPEGKYLRHTILRGGSAMGYFLVRNLLYTGDLIVASGHKPRKVMFGDIELPRDSRYYNAFIAAFRP